ncbi:hypothetical protein B0H11DRAFT_1933954 [Mycena galericulata]|nr:hypothetical protein B0H11DRAFT_1933954 [Mycena galericulata]
MPRAEPSRTPAAPIGGSARRAAGFLGSPPRSSSSRFRRSMLSSRDAAVIGWVVEALHLDRVSGAFEWLIVPKTKVKAGGNMKESGRVVTLRILLKRNVRDPGYVDGAPSPGGAASFAYGREERPVAPAKIRVRASEVRTGRVGYRESPGAGYILFVDVEGGIALRGVFSPMPIFLVRFRLWVGWDGGEKMICVGLRLGDAGAVSRLTLWAWAWASRTTHPGRQGKYRSREQGIWDLRSPAWVGVAWAGGEMYILSPKIFLHDRRARAPELY